MLSYLFYCMYQPCVVFSFDLLVDSSDIYLCFSQCELPLHVELAAENVNLEEEVSLERLQLHQQVIVPVLLHHPAVCQLTQL